ncbi:class I SAM-dependent methyltransferase [Aureibacter tunicatorum]|uniref:SAM-dependent methyltransferase n=1 Tax=Aureibacter tunicatorum TaxID=866807 RepID=A0AAE4BUD3_9BACT|nr:class I SAM-dependent methyltransferase [Aureibacter tunicatorum]MDR6240612.1 SAM-dependent methyltransferase [Aureibacter tunicatorum]BDD06527.1 methyltransferase [Aureibacter tunicatorum]
MNSQKEIELKELSSQLSKPDGKNGVDVAFAMNETNKEMVRYSIEELNASDKNLILEIGHGNALHLTDIMDDAGELHYTGLEISETMQEEAVRINKKYVEARQAEFLVYDGELLPFEDNAFDKIMTVNTIYFWSNPISFAKEIYRVLKPGGVLVITFATKEFMVNLPLADDRFELYNEEIFRSLIDETSLRIMEIIKRQDRVDSQLIELANRDYLISKLTK